jgi:hypothetical protein
LTGILLVCVVQPLNGVAFVLDGHLIGALVISVPISYASLRFGWGLSGILNGIGGLMCWRCATDVSRFLGQKWAN